MLDATMDKPAQQSEEKENKAFFAKALEVAAYPLSAMAGYLFTKRSIHDSAYDNAKFMGAVDGVSAPHRKQLVKIGEQANSVVNAGKEFDLIAATAKEFIHHPGNVDKRMEQLGLGSLVKQWKFTSPYQKQKALMHGFGAVGVTIGAMLLVAESKIFNDFFTKKSNDNQPER